MNEENWNAGMMVSPIFQLFQASILPDFIMKTLLFFKKNLFENSLINRNLITFFGFVILS